MVVKSVQPGEAVSPGFSQEASRVQVTQRPDNSDSPNLREPYSLDISSGSYSNRSVANHDRIALNETIDAVQLALHSVSSMEQIVDGVDGLASVAMENEGSERTLVLVEKEGAGMLNALRDITTASTSAGVRPLAGDPIRLELERTLGPVLEVILPDQKKDPLGIQKLSFASKDMILATVAKIANAREQLRDLRTAVTDGLEQLAIIAQEQRRSYAAKPGSGGLLQVADEALSAAWDVREQVLSHPDGEERPHLVRHESAVDLLSSFHAGRVNTRA